MPDVATFLSTPDSACSQATPGRRLLILEIKDWQRETIRDANPEQFTLATATGRKVVGSPLKQVRQFAHAVVDLLKSDPHSPWRTGSIS